MNAARAERRAHSNVQVDRVFYALADPTRRAIVKRLCAGPQSVSKLAAPLGVTLTAVGQHLQVLEESGLARTEKKGRVRMCQVDPEGLSVVEWWVRDQRALWESRLDRLGEVLAETGSGKDRE